MKKFLSVTIQSLITITFCFILICQTTVLAQTQEEEVNRTGELPSHMFDTRTLSMGNTTIADLYGRPAIGINAALTGLINKPAFVQLNTNHNWGNNLMTNDLTLPTYSIGPHHITTRLGLLHKSFKDLPFTNSSTLQEPDFTMYRAEVAYAMTISDYFSVGTLHSISFSTASNTADNWNYFIDVGLVYAPDGPVSYGMVLRGLGDKTTYEIDETGQTRFSNHIARQILEIGATLRFPVEERTYLSISFANEKRFDESGLWYKGGFELIPYSFISFRGGAMVNFDNSQFIPRAGLGINVRMIQIDYMISPKDVIGEQFHQFGLTVHF